VLREPTATCRARRTKNAVARCSSSSPRWQLWLFSYSVFVVGQLLLGGLVVLFLFVLSSIYHFFFRLFRRFVRAHERIATALESRTDVGRSDDRR